MYAVTYGQHLKRIMETMMKNLTLSNRLVIDDTDYNPDDSRSHTSLLLSVVGAASCITYMTWASKQIAFFSTQEDPRTCGFKRGEGISFANNFKHKQDFVPASSENCFSRLLSSNLQRVLRKEKSREKMKNTRREEFSSVTHLSELLAEQV